MRMSKELPIVRYAYGVAAALLLGGTAFSVATGEAGAQVAQNAPAQFAPRPGAPLSFADLAARLQPAVVNISTKQRIAVRRQADPFEEFFRRFGTPDGAAPPGQGGQGGGSAPQTRETGSLGSGFIISPDGYVVTNNHLIQGANGQGTVDSVTVILTDRKEYAARIVGRDSASDLALLKIEGSNLPYVNWGDSTRVRVGDWVIAIGNPYGLGGTVTAGIISALHRGITGFGAYDRYLQTDASINMGNSGGPMFDMAGNVIGINSALISPTGASVGIGLAIPAELAKPVIDSLRRGQAPQRGYLGVSLQPLDENIAASLGLPKDKGEIVRSVVPGEAAQRSGIQQGDVILRVNGQEVNPDQTVSFLVANTTVGARVPVDIVRDGRPRTLQVLIGQRPTEEVLLKQIGGDEAEDSPMAAETPVAPGSALGLSLQALTPAIARALNLPADVRGVVVTAVDQASDAYEKGIRRGFVIISVDRKPVSTPQQVAAAVEAVRRAGRTSVLMLVKTGRSPEAFVGIDLARYRGAAPRPGRRARPIECLAQWRGARHTRGHDQHLHRRRPRRRPSAVARTQARQTPRTDRGGDGHGQDRHPAGDRRGTLRGGGSDLRRRRQRRPCRACHAGQSVGQESPGFRRAGRRDRRHGLGLSGLPGAIVGLVRRAGPCRPHHGQRNGPAAAGAADEPQRGAGRSPRDRLPRRRQGRADAARPRRPPGDAGPHRRARRRADA
jgi:serine protease Do